MAEFAEMTTEQKRANLRELADYLDTGVTEYGFDMDTFMNECGTVACAAGHAPFVLGHDVDPRAGGFAGYVDAVLLPGEKCSQFPLFEWMFGAGWRSVDGTARGAAARIYYYLDNGLPKIEDIWGMMSGRIPLCYEVKPLPTVAPRRYRRAGVDASVRKVTEGARS